MADKTITNGGAKASANISVDYSTYKASRTISNIQSTRFKTNIVNDTIDFSVFLEPTEHNIETYKTNLQGDVENYDAILNNLRESGKAFDESRVKEFINETLKKELLENPENKINLFINDRNNYELRKFDPNGALISLSEYNQDGQLLRNTNFDTYERPQATQDFSNNNNDQSHEKVQDGRPADELQNPTETSYNKYEPTNATLTGSPKPDGSLTGEPNPEGALTGDPNNEGLSENERRVTPSTEQVKPESTINIENQDGSVIHEGSTNVDTSSGGTPNITFGNE